MLWRYMHNHYTLPDPNNRINQFILFLFKYRLLWVAIILLIMAVFIFHVWETSDQENKLKNVISIMTGGSIIIAIIYAIINYENIQLKNRHDIKNIKETLTFTTACKMHDPVMVNNLKRIHAFRKKNNKLFDGSNFFMIKKVLSNNEKLRLSVLLGFNYLECIAIGIEQGIMDEKFMKLFIRGIVVSLQNDYGNYFEYVRDKTNNTQYYIHFTQLAKKWK